MSGKTKASAALLAAIWILTAALASGDPGERIRGTNRHYREGDWTTWSSLRHIRNLCVAPDRVYFATTGGIGCYNPLSQSWERPQTVSNGLASADIDLVAFDENSGSLWCAQREGLSCLGPASHVWTNLFYDETGFRPGERAVSLGFGSDHFLYGMTSSGRTFALWANSGVVEWDKSPAAEIQIVWFGQAAPAEPPPPHLFLPPGYFYEDQTRRITDLHNRSFPLTCWKRDSWNSLWLGSWGLGAARVDLLTGRYQPLPYGLWDDAVAAMAYDQEALWLGGDQALQGYGGMTRWEVDRRDPDFIEPRFLTGFSDDRITAMAFDDAFLWFGTRNGLTRYDVKRANWRTLSQAEHLPDPRITHLYMDRNYLWVATESGLARLLKSSFGKTDSLVINSVDLRHLGTLRISFLAPQGDTLWVATELGLYLFNTRTDSGFFYNEGFYPVQEEIEAVACWNDEVWFGTAAGIGGFNARTKEWFAPPEQRLESVGKIHWMAADAASVWVASDQGVRRYERRGRRWIRYAMTDGLPTLEVLTLMLNGDYIWFGTPRGLTLFYWNAPYRID
ncbi:MAG TPA: hypothetical protein PLG50_01785 [bacterium]|nr:hypothetical protein [bacterium]HQG44374.1 hypothetical protein [bacterium]HQI47318.1 hypothetical protein [bacterium]HQJ63407.1 hypothetical protein [bacterium]